MQKPPFATPAPACFSLRFGAKAERLKSFFFKKIATDSFNHAPCFAPRWRIRSRQKKIGAKFGCKRPPSAPPAPARCHNPLWRPTASDQRGGDLVPLFIRRRRWGDTDGLASGGDHPPPGIAHRAASVLLAPIWAIMLALYRPSVSCENGSGQR